MVRTYTGTGNFFFGWIMGDSLKFIHSCRRKEGHFQCKCPFLLPLSGVAYLVAFSRATALKSRIKPLSTTIMLLSRYEVTPNSLHISNTHLRYPVKLASQSASFVDPIPSLNTPLPLGMSLSPATFHRAEILILDIVMMAFISSRRLVERSSWIQYLTMCCIGIHGQGEE